MKKLLAVLILCMTVSCIFFGCSGKNAEKAGEKIGFDIIISETVVNCKAGEMTDEILLSKVQVVKGDGSTATPVLDKGSADYSVAGEYIINFSYEDIVKTLTLRIFDMPKIYYNEQEVNGDTVILSYGEAKRSCDFVKGISVKDSFGTLLNFTKTADSDDFDYDKNAFSVTYLAEDDGGNRFSKTINYSLSTEFDPEVESITFDMQNDEDIELSFNLKGDTDFLLYNKSEIVPEKYYEQSGDKLIISKRFINTLAIGTNKLRVETLNGNGAFTLDILDNGKPFFTMESEDEPVILVESKTLSVGLPNVVISGHSYSWNYSLTNRDNSEYVCSVENKNNALFLSDGNGESLSVGRYYLNITATNGQGSLSKFLDVRVFPQQKEWTAHTGSIVEYGVYEDENVTRARSTLSSSKESVLSIPQSRFAGYSTITFDVLISDYEFYSNSDKDKTSPYLIFWQGVNNDEKDKPEDADENWCPDYLNVDKRLTPRGVYAGRETIIDLTTNEEVAWDQGWEKNRWYRITLT
ncbi:MAG: hypothetical protein IJQ66_00275, partial [Clostridia bacterium]|nr:hypothetical protein [Clostridia bacterium]